MNDESAPKGAHESATTGPSVTAGSLNLDDRIAAFEAGRQQGKAECLEMAIEEQVHARLHQISLEALGMAQRHAADTGPAWAAMIAWAGESE